jgi:thiol-disulfide isomerase/thioredoxin
VAVIVGLFAFSSAAYSQTPEFPQDPAQWINARPITLDKIKGKAVFLWYFSDECPVCRGKWPELMKMAKKYTGQPILFVAVSSGDQRSVLEEYVRETKLDWPLLVDTNRAFEKQSGIVPEISLENIYQIKIITADGHMQWGNWEDMLATITTALKTAKWKVDPKDIPPKLQVAWEGIEFGNYTTAGPILKRALKAPDLETKAAAEKLQAVVQVEIDALLNKAKDAEANGNSWDAYSLYCEFSQKFPGFDLPADASDSKKKLASDPKIKAGIVAQHQLDSAKKLLDSGKPINQKKAALILEKVVKDSPDSSAGKEAKQLLSASTATK